MNHVKVSAIMQVRTGSTRLPGKALKTICGKTVTELIIERAKRMAVDVIVAAIPEREDAAFERLLLAAGIQVFRGSEEHVLSRFAGADAKHPADIIVRVNGDNLFVHPPYAGEAAGLLAKSGADYASVSGAPIGCGVDVFTSAALRKAFALPDLSPVEKEHVIPVFFRQGLFRRAEVRASGALAREKLRLTLDTQQDFDMISRLYEALYRPGDIIPLEAAIGYLDAHPEVASLNKDIAQKGWK